MTAPGRASRRSAARLAAAVAGGGALALTVLPGIGSAASAPAPSACSRDWPMYQHDASRTGAACGAGVTTTNAATLLPAWQARTANPVTATPTVAGGRVFVGDAGGIFYALDRTTGARKWTFSVTSPTNGCHADQHHVDYGEITSSAAVASLPRGRQLVIFGGGGTLYALDAATGACVWQQDLDPRNPKSSMEIESSPAVAAVRGQGVLVFVGSDSNENPGGSAPPGVQAFDAATGALKWKYEPETGPAGTKVGTLDAPSDTNGCGDVWSSPAVDPGAHSGHGLVVFGTGNCPTRSTVDAIVAVDATSGDQVWRFTEPANDYTSARFADGGDTDFGSSPIITTLGSTRAVIEAGKSGYVYAVAEDPPAGAPTRLLWSSQAAQPGQLGDQFGGAVGGFIGAAALGAAVPSGSAAPESTWFGASAITTPLSSQSTSTNPAVPLPDTSLACVDEGHGYAPTVATPACDPLRAASLHAVDAASGVVRWQQPVSLPSYSAVTYAGGVVFAPSTTGFQIDAYDAGTGARLWSFPLGAAVASGAAVAGPAVFLGSGISEGGSAVPGINAVWAFCVAGHC
ncbi:MAG TPA: PQQ-binding-like beta-propeller repeat protein [Acidimicrobiales bacterium]|nr:PQQ-binding-like beta-propeller repeat protein [Acidimicrobiales bacterium]